MLSVVSEFIDLETAAERFGLTPRQLRRLIVAGKLPASKPGRALMVRPDDVRAVLSPTVRTPRASGIRRGEGIDDELRAAGFAPACGPIGRGAL